MVGYIPKNIRLALIVAFIVGAGAGCFQEEWSGFVYPNKNNLTNHRAIGNFSSLEQCRSASVSLIKNSKWRNADYECGLNCNRSSLPMICEKTEH
jgi:hypothetical protein